MSKRTRLLFGMTALASAACSLVIGIDGDILEPPAEADDGGSADRVPIPPPMLVVEPLGRITQGGTTALHLSRAPGNTGRLTRLKLELPAGVTARPSADVVKEGGSLTITLEAAFNATRGVSDVVVIGFDDQQDSGEGGRFTKPLEITGNLDTTFGKQGLAIIPFEGEQSPAGDHEDFGIAVDPKTGQIYVTFNRSVNEAASASIARCDANGRLDTSYGSAGFLDVTTFAISRGRAVFVDPGGRVLLVGDRDDTNAFTLVSPGGTPRSFPLGGTNESLVVNDAVKLPSGDFVAVATVADINGVGTTHLIRANDAGAPSNAEVSLDGMAEGAGVAAGTDGKPVIFGVTNFNTIVARRLADGGPDPSFGDGGVVTANDSEPNRPYGGAVDGSGRILVAGELGPRDTPARSATFARLARLTSTGAVDSTFGDGGGVVVFGTPQGKLFDARARAVLPVANQRMLVAISGVNSEAADGGATDEQIAIARFLDSGEIDVSFGFNGFSIVKPMVDVRRLVRQGNDVIVAAVAVSKADPNAHDVVLLRYNPEREK